ncbi:MAG: amino acid transporter substrate-binding protein [Brevundimonas sp.]|nr:amino acid transporter substrate-binding protein [Brevundimonas sp.]
MQGPIGVRRLAVLAIVLATLAGCGRREAPVSAPAIEAPSASIVKTGDRAVSPTLAAVRQRGYLNCGVHQGLVGFAYTDNRGEWRGFDVDFCRVMAAAIFGDATKARFVPLTADTRFEALTSGQIDVLWRNSSWTMERDTAGPFAFAGINYYDGQGFMVRRALDLNSATELTGARVCVAAGSTSAQNAADYFRARGIAYTPVVAPSEEAARQAYGREDCDAFTADVSALAAARTTMADPQQHVILAEVISKEPLGPVTRRGDEQWTALVRWSLQSVILAEELGVTKANARSLAKDATDPRVRRLVGLNEDFGSHLGLSKTWAVDAVAEVGNYGEIFARNLGPDSALDLARGLNAQWNARPAGLIYGLPIR